MTNRILSRMHIVQVIVTCGLAALGYFLLDPDQLVPVHWNFYGEVDNFWPAKWALLVGPVLSGVLLSVFAAIGAREQGAWLSPLTTTALALVMLIEAIILLSALGTSMDVVRVTTLAVGLLLTIVGNYLPKSQPNHYFGMRFPWTLNNEAVWQRSNAFAGWFFVVVGVGVALFAALFEVAAPYYFAILLAGVLAAIIISTAYSFRVSKNTG